MLNMIKKVFTPDMKNPESNILTREQDVQRKMLQYKGMADEIIEYCGDFNNKTILEVGSGGREECLSNYIATNFQLDKIYATDPVVKTNKVFNDQFEIRKEDIRQTTFDDNQFDLIISIAAFEHIPDLDQALKEMFRILKPGGLIYTKFGPIWSGAWGHHLWLQKNETLYNYVNTFLPPFCHLLMTENELQSYCIDKMNIPKKDSKAISKFVFNDKGQNRLFYSDYEKIIEASPFEILFFFGSNNFPLKKEFKVESYKELMRKLNSKYPEKSGWTYNSIFLMLYKPE